MCYKKLPVIFLYFLVTNYVSLSASSAAANVELRPESCLKPIELRPDEHRMLNELIAFYYQGERSQHYLTQRDGKHLVILDRAKPVSQQISLIIQQTYQECLDDASKNDFKVALKAAHDAVTRDRDSAYLQDKCAGTMHPGKLLLATINGSPASFAGWWRYMMAYNAAQAALERDDDKETATIDTLFIYLWGLLLHRFVPDYMTICGDFRENLAHKWALSYSAPEIKVEFLENLRDLAYNATEFIGAPGPCGIFLLFKQAIRLMLADLKKYNLPSTTTQESIEDDLLRAIDKDEDDFLLRCWLTATEPDHRAMPLFTDDSLSLTDK